jgi:LmbE family N-acetylglucosaminyl deacetylase
MTDYFSTFVRPIPIRAPFGDSMLVVAPHQDDETIGCGGVLALQVRAKRPVSVVLLHDGADGHDELGMTRPELVALRNEESRRAAAILGMEPPIFLSYPDLTASSAQAAEALRRIITDRKVDAVFVPFMLDGHPDHRKANYILAAALKKIEHHVRIFGYEVWGLSIPNVIVVIDDVMEQKLAMLRCFEFANKAVDYVNTTQGLNMYRSRMLGSGVSKYAECFFEIPSPEYIDLVERVHEGEA